MDVNISLCWICCKQLEKIEINKKITFKTPTTNSVINTKDALFYVVPEVNLGILEQMELCNKCLENLRSAYEFKHECLLALTKISRYLKEIQLSLEDAEKNDPLKENNLSLLPKPPENIFENCPLKSNKNGDTVSTTPDISIQNINCQSETPDLRICEITGSLEVELGQYFSITGQTGKCFETKAVQTEENAVFEATKVKRKMKDRKDHNLNNNMLQVPTVKNSKNVAPYKGKKTSLLGTEPDHDLSKNTLITLRFSTNSSNTSDKIGKNLHSNVSPSGKTLFENAYCQYLNMQRKMIQEAMMNKSNMSDEEGEASQMEAVDHVTPEQENITESPEPSFCEVTGLFKDNYNQYYSTDGQLMDPSELEKEAESALEKANSIFTEPIVNIEPVESGSTNNHTEPTVNSKPVISEGQPIVPIHSMCATAGILTPVTVTENNGIFSIKLVGDAVKNSFPTLQNPFMIEDMIDIKEEPLEDSPCTTDEDTVSAPETEVQINEGFGAVDEYIDIPDLVMFDKDSENMDKNIKTLQPRTAKKPLMFVRSAKTLHDSNPGLLWFSGGPIVIPALSPFPNSSPIVADLVQPKKIRRYQRIKMVHVPESETTSIPEASVEVDHSIYPIRKQHHNSYSNEYLASFFTKDGYYRYDHDYIVNMYHHSVAIMLDPIVGKKLWFCRLCNNQHWTLNHGEHMLEAHATNTRCTVCDVDMHSPFALNLHVEQHTEMCQYSTESMTYGARDSHARKHQAEEHCHKATAKKKKRYYKRKTPKRRRKRGNEVVPPPEIPSSNWVQDEVVERAQIARLTYEEAELERLLKKIDESQDTPDHVTGDSLFSPSPVQNRKLTGKRRKNKGKSVPVVPSRNGKGKSVPLIPSRKLLRSRKRKAQK